MPRTQPSFLHVIANQSADWCGNPYPYLRGNSPSGNPFPLRTGQFYRSAQKYASFRMRISGLALSICAARCLRKRKRLPNRCGRWAPPLAALPCGPRRFAPRNDSAGRNPVIKIRVLTKTDRQNINFSLAFSSSATSRGSGKQIAAPVRAPARQGQTLGHPFCHSSEWPFSQTS